VNGQEVGGAQPDATAQLIRTRLQTLSPERLELGREVMRSIYSLNYAAAEQTCLRLIKIDPGDPLGYALLARNVS